MDDRTVIEYLVRKYGAELYRYCLYGVGGDRKMAEDVLGEVWLVVVRKAAKLRFGKDIKTYLLRVADNCIKRAKKADAEKRCHERSLEEWAERSGDKLAEYDEYFSDPRGDDELLEALATRFSEEDRSLFVMRFIEKKTYAEISEKTGTPISTVAFRISKMKEYAKTIINKL